MFKLPNLGINFNRPMSPPFSPKAGISDTPKLKNYSNASQGYAKAMEKHFGHDMEKLSHHVKNLPAEEQAAIIDGSKAFREYLGIRNPERLSQKLELPSSSSHITNRIPINEAPDALAIAATRSGDEGRVMRSLDRLEESLGQIKKENKMPLTHRPLILPALNQLATGLSNLKTEAALEKAVKILKNGKHIFDKNTVQAISSFAQKVSGNQHINKKLKEDLLELSNIYVDESIWKNSEIALKKRAGDREKARYLKSPAQQQHRLNGLAKQAELVNPPKIPARPLNMANTAGVLFKTRLLENNENEPGRIAVFGNRYALQPGKTVDLFAPFTPGAKNNELNMMNSFVRGADGMIRRFPGSRRNPLDRNYVRQIESGMIYDSDKKHIVSYVAGYKLNSKDGTGAFEVEGIKQKPIFKDSDTEVYKLGKNRYMVPQNEFTSCTYACENMLLMGQGYLRPDEPIIDDGRRDLPAILNSIKKNTRGVDPILFETRFDSNEKNESSKENSAAIRDLKNKIEKFGPCVFSAGGHDRMLDEIQEKNGKFFFTIRDPFHGTCNVVKGLQPLLISSDKNVIRNFTAVFLPRKTDSKH